MLPGPLKHAMIHWPQKRSYHSVSSLSLPLHISLHSAKKHTHAPNKTEQQYIPAQISDKREKRNEIWKWALKINQQQQSEKWK